LPDDAGLLNGLQAVDSWNVFFNYPEGAILGLYAATLYLPSVFTAYVGDMLSQRFGRRIALALGSLLVFAGGLINAFATNAAMWIAGKFAIMFLVSTFYRQSARSRCHRFWGWLSQGRGSGSHPGDCAPATTTDVSFLLLSLLLFWRPSFSVTVL